MGYPVLLLAFDVAVPHHVAMVANDAGELLADDAHLEVWQHLVPGHFFHRDVASIVSSIRVGSELQQEYGYVFCAADGCEVERGVVILICDVWIGSMLQQQLQDIRLGVVASRLEQRSPALGVHVVHIALGDDQSFADRVVLLHTSQGQGTLTTTVGRSGRSAEPQKQLHNLEMAIDRCFHQTGGLSVVDAIDLESALPLLGALFVELLLLLAPVQKDHLDDVLEPSGRSNVQRIASISVHESDVDSVDEQQVQNVELALLGGNQQAVDGVVVHGVRISASHVDEVVHKDEVRVARVARVEQSVVAAHLSGHLDVDELMELLRREQLPGFLEQLLHRVHVAHDASNHETRQLVDSDLACLLVLDDAQRIQQLGVLAAQGFDQEVVGFHAGAGGSTRQLVLPGVLAENLLLLLLDSALLQVPVAAQDLSVSFE